METTTFDKLPDGARFVFGEFDLQAGLSCTTSVCIKLGNDYLIIKTGDRLRILEGVHAPGGPKVTDISRLYPAQWHKERLAGFVRRAVTFRMLSDGMKFRFDDGPAIDAIKVGHDCYVALQVPHVMHCLCTDPEVHFIPEPNEEQPMNDPYNDRKQAEQLGALAVCAHLRRNNIVASIAKGVRDAAIAAFALSRQTSVSFVLDRRTPRGCTHDPINHAHDMGLVEEGLALLRGAGTANERDPMFAVLQRDALGLAPAGTYSIKAWLSEAHFNADMQAAQDRDAEAALRELEALKRSEVRRARWKKIGSGVLKVLSYLGTAAGGAVIAHLFDDAVRDLVALLY